jgi:F0F1-type ATP synthase assembly protein I
MSSTTTTSPEIAPERTGGRFAGAVSSEWTKFWTLRSTWWCLLSATFVLAAFTAVVSLATRLQIEGENGVPGSFLVGRVGVTSLQIVQFATIALAVLAICSEYQTGSIRSTLQWVPKRGRMVLSKTFVVTVVTLGTGIVWGLLGDGIAWIALGPYRAGGFGDVLRDVLAVSVYLTALSLFSLGLGFAIRSTAGTFGLVLVLLLGLPAAFSAVDNAALNTLGQYLPLSAGGYLIDRATEPYGMVTAILVLAAWSVGSIALGAIMVKRRDA